MSISANKRSPSLYALWLLLDGFNYYGFIAFITLYLHQSQQLSYQSAYILYGIFTSFSYVTPLLLGLLADRLYGSAPVLITSTLAMLFGYSLLYIDHHLSFIFGGILFLFGSGGLKCMVYKMLSEACSTSSSKNRDKIFSIFYAIYNLGAILAAIILGFFVSDGQWHVMFIIGIIASLIGCVASFSVFTPLAHWQKITGLSIMIAAMTAIFSVLLIHPFFFKVSLVGIVLLMVIYIITLIAKQYHAYLPGILYLLFLNLIMVIFFTAEMQYGGSLMVYLANHIHVNIFSYSIPSQELSLLLPLFVIIGLFVCLPVINILNKQYFVATTLIKLAISMIMCALSLAIFAAMPFVTKTIGNNFIIANLILGFLFLGFGEIIIASTITSATAILSPNQLRGIFIGTYYLSTACSGWLAGVFSRWTIPSSTTKNNFSTVYWQFSSLCTIIAIMLIILWIIFRRSNIDFQKKNLTFNQNNVDPI